MAKAHLQSVWAREASLFAFLADRFARPKSGATDPRTLIPEIYRPPAREVRATPASNEMAWALMGEAFKQMAAHRAPAQRPKDKPLKPKPLKQV